MDGFKLLARRFFCDWHLPEGLPEVRLDVDYFVDKIVEMGGQSLDFMGKSAFGNSLYPSSVERGNKSIPGDGDIFGKVCRAAKERGLEFLTYYNMTLNDALAEEHPEWRQVDKNGNPLKFESYHMFCMNTPYRERVYKHHAEIISNFATDGFNLDLQYFHSRGCFCPWCKEKFRARFGYSLDPDRFESARNWIDLWTFQKESRRDFILGAMKSAEAVRPGLIWTWNHSGDFTSNVELDSSATYLGCEAHPPAYFECIARAKCMQSTGKTFEFWMPESIGSWGHWTLTTEGTLKGMCALALSHGGAISFNHVPPPCGDYGGRIMPGVYKTLGNVMGWIKEREHLCIGKQSVPVTAILNSAKNNGLQRAHVLESINRGPDTPATGHHALGDENCISACKVLSECHIAADFLYHEGAMDRLPEYEALILPNVACMDDATAERIKSYAREGGKVLAFYNTSLLDEEAQERENFLLADLFGADFAGWSPYSISYVDRFRGGFGENLPEMPILVKDTGYQQNSPHHAACCRLRDGAKALAYFTEPILESNWDAGYHIYHDHSPAGRCTENPAIILNRYGKGACIFMPFPLLQTYSFQPDPRQREMVRKALEMLGVPGKVKFNMPYSVQGSVTEDEEGWLVHLIRIQKETGTMFLDDTSPSGAAGCSVFPGWDVSSVENAMTGEPVGYSRAEGGITFTVPDVLDYLIVRVRRA